MKVRAALAVEAAMLAAVHATAFDKSWNATAISALLAAPGALAFVVGTRDRPAGFILCRVAADEGEILTLAVRPRQRRRGLAAALLTVAVEALTARGACRLFLEVAADNLAARAFYAKAGFVAVGARPAYYRRGESGGDAILLRRELNR
ncbi:MAG: ribosomal protein S18-alanine N-acetyltransferase [Caulobacteraceae bacterium]